MPGIMEIEKAAIAPPWPEGALLAEIGGGDSVFLTAEEAGAVLGFLLLREISGEAELYQIAVREDARGRGVGTALMSAAIEAAAARGIDRIFLEVRAGNEPARRLYAAHGFTPMGIRKNYYIQPTENAVIMKKEMGNANAHTFD